MPDNLLKTVNLSLFVGERQLIKRLNWQVNAGECWCIIGRNGVGKSTLLRTLAGLVNVPQEQGEIRMKDQPLTQWPLSSLAKIRSYLPQERYDAFAYQVIETVLAARHPYSDGCYWESAEDVTIALAALAEMDVAGLAERDIRHLSGGERQRVAIAALLAQDAQLMLLDEPARSLDLAHQISAIQLLSERCKTQHKAVLMVSHDVNLVSRVATHALLIMGNGSWQAGQVSQMMTQDALSRCLGYPIEILLHNKQQIFLPVHSTPI